MPNLNQFEEHFLDSCIILYKLLGSKKCVVEYFKENHNRYISRRVKREVENIIQGRREILAFLDWLEKQEIKKREINEIIDLLSTYELVNPKNMEFMEKFVDKYLETIKDFLINGNKSIFEIIENVSETLLKVLDQWEKLLRENRIKLHQSHFYVECYYYFEYTGLMKIMNYENDAKILLDAYDLSKKIIKNIAFLTSDKKHILNNKNEIENKIIAFNEEFDSYNDTTLGWWEFNIIDDSMKVVTPDVVYNPSSQKLEKNNKEVNSYSIYIKDKDLLVGFPSKVTDEQATVILMNNNIIPPEPSLWQKLFGKKEVPMPQKEAVNQMMFQYDNDKNIIPDKSLDIKTFPYDYDIPIISEPEHKTSGATRQWRTNSEKAQSRQYSKSANPRLVPAEPSFYRDKARPVLQKAGLVESNEQKRAKDAISLSLAKQIEKKHNVGIDEALRFVDENYDDIIYDKFGTLTPAKAQEKLVSLSLNYHEKENTGNKIIKIDRGIQKVLDLIGNFAWDVAPTLVQFVVTISVLIFIDWRFSVLILFFAPIFLYVTFYVNRSIYPVRKKRYKKGEEASGKMAQSIININAVKSFVQEKREIKEFKENDKYRKRRKNGVVLYHEVLSFHKEDSHNLTHYFLFDTQFYY